MSKHLFTNNRCLFVAIILLSFFFSCQHSKKKEFIFYKSQGSPDLHVRWMPFIPKTTDSYQFNQFEEVSFRGLSGKKISIDTVKIDRSDSQLIIQGADRSIGFTQVPFDSTKAKVSVRRELYTPVLKGVIKGPLYIDSAAFTYSPSPHFKNMDINSIYLNDLGAEAMNIIGHSDLRLSIGKISLKALTVSGNNIGKRPPLISFDYDPYINLGDSAAFVRGKYDVQELGFYNVSLNSIRSRFIRSMRIDSCKWADTTDIICDSVKMFLFNNVKFYSGSGVVTLGNATSGAKLYLRKVEMSKFNFDYSHFQFIPLAVEMYRDENEWYSDVTSIYQGIIASQTRLNNAAGIKASSIELAEFQDSQAWYAWPIIPLKIWWNNYGFDKSKVVLSSLELFCIFLFLNLFFFRALLEHYDVAELKNALNSSTAMRSITFQRTYRFFLVLIYTGIIFYGLKFDFTKLSTKNLGIVLLLFFEYTAGLIAIAYIASLIIVK
ncbi:MAG: hypothetical protein V4577_06710 [Bacteroidota bacterium]